MVHYTPLHFDFKTYPHVDMYDQEVSAAVVLMDVIVDKKVYFAAHEDIHNVSIFGDFHYVNS